MADEIRASEVVILELTKDIGNSMKKIALETDELESALKILGHTFEDDGFNVVSNYVVHTKQNVQAILPDVKIVMQRLIDYAGYIKESKKNL